MCVRACGRNARATDVGSPRGRYGYIGPMTCNYIDFKFLPTHEYLARRVVCKSERERDKCDFSRSFDDEGVGRVMDRAMRRVFEITKLFQ